MGCITIWIPTEASNVSYPGRKPDRAFYPDRKLYITDMYLPSVFDVSLS